MRAVIFANGSIANFDYIVNLIQDDDFIVCADGAARILKKIGLSPDVWIGDMDSCAMSDDEFDEFTNNCDVIKLNPVKDATDTECACDYVIEHGFSKVLLLGFSGSRLDHTLANIFLLKKFSDAGVTAYAVDEHNIISFAEPHNEIRPVPGFDNISLIPIAGDIADVSNEGMYYRLSGERLSMFSSRGISNKAVSGECTIDIGCGCALIVQSRD